MLLLSLCMPTNGVIEWVFPVLDSIYGQGVDENLYEIVITDNGDNQEFKRKMQIYIKEHSNITYAETEALPFINEIEAYRRAKGELIKFVNHRTLLVTGALECLITYSKNNLNKKPITYFSNGVLKLEKGVNKFDSFDLFVKNLSYWSSWSTGMTIWKADFEKLTENVSNFNELFPHTNVLFSERNRGEYVIDNSVIFDEMPQGKKPKGNYDLFGAFGIEYPGIIFDLLRDGDITNQTFSYVIDKNLEFIATLYFHYIIKKDYSSYDLNGLSRIFGVFYTKVRLRKKVCKYFIESIKKILGR